MALEPENVRLDGRVAVVTGAARGIGRAISLALARFGADLAICDRDEEGLASLADEIDGLRRGVLAGVLDVREPDAVDSFLNDVSATYGRVEILVNNAGGGFEAPFIELRSKGQEALIAENFSSVTHFVRGVLPLVPGTGGSIINITSIEAHRAGPGFAIYSAMKAAVANLSCSLALELGDRLIRVNCVAPDVISTPGVGEVGGGTPLLRRGHVDDVAGAVVFLAGDLSRFVTGTTIHVDGGNWAAGGWRRDADGAFRP